MANLRASAVSAATPSMGWTRLPVELALVGVTLASIYQLGPLFIDNSYFPPLALIAVVIHATLAITRRLRLGAIFGVLIAAVVLPIVIGLMFYPETLVIIIPTGATLEAARTELLYGWQNFQTATPPTEVTTAYLVAASFVVWTVAVLSDWAAFRFWSPGEALLPSLSAVVFASFLDRIFIDVRGAFVYLASALIFVLFHRVSERISTGTWLGNGSAKSFIQLLIGGTVITGLALGLAWMLAPSLPGYQEQPVYPVFDPESGGPDQDKERTVANPLVDIKDRLQSDPELEVFTVRSDQPTYWRTTALGLFDGTQFRARATYEAADSDLPQGFPFQIPASDITASTQEFSISALSQEWLPAAYLPVKIDTGDVDVQFEPDSATLITGGQQLLSNGMTYRVESQIPRFTPDNLQSLSGGSVDEIYKELPVDFDPAITQLAQEITTGSDSTYAKALALQDYFRRTGGFEYSLVPPKGHNVASITEFLERRSGYCEQFSVTYAAMARAVGIPSRIAVGFTEGVQDPNDPTLYHVQNKHAHAWPEVYIAGAGWVPFEPTPGRGMTGAEQYTLLPAEQQDQGPAPTPTPQPEQQPQPENEAAAPPPPPTPTPVPSDAPTPTQPPQTTRDTPQRMVVLANAIWGWVRSNQLFFVVTGTLSALALLALFAIHELKVQRYVLRRSDGRGWSLHQITEPGERIQRAWRIAADAIAFDGPAPDKSETNAEFANRAAEADPNVALSAATLRQLGATATASRFSSRPVSAADVEKAEGLSAELVDASFVHRSRLERWAWNLDPRPLVESWRRRGVEKVPTTPEAPGAPRMTSVHATVIPPPPSGALPSAPESTEATPTPESAPA